MTSEPVRLATTAASDPYARGRELGAGNAGAVREAYARYGELWGAYGVAAGEVRTVGKAVLDPVADFHPPARAEIAGIAAGAGLADWQVGALNARTELLALGDQRLVAAGRLPGDGGECSTLVRLPAGGSPLTAQTWDWHSPLARSWFVWTLEPSAGRRVATLTEYGIVGKLGVASRTGADGVRRGVLSAHFNAVRHRADTGLGGVPVHVVARRVLDEADSMQDAVEIAAKAEVSASVALTVTARDEDSGHWVAATLELHPGGPSLQRMSDVGRDGCWLAHTNHFVAPDAAGDDVRSPVSTTVERLDRVAAVASAAHPRTAQQAAELLATHDLGSRSVCVHGFPDAPVGQRTATLAVAVTEPATGRLHVHAGKPCEARADSWWSG